MPGDAAPLLIVLAVKPQMFRDAGPQLRSIVGASTLVVSIMAGTTIAALTEVCGGRVIRAMPNTPAAIGRGITVAVPAGDVTPGVISKGVEAEATLYPVRNLALGAPGALPRQRFDLAHADLKHGPAGGSRTKA